MSPQLRVSALSQKIWIFETLPIEKTEFFRNVDALDIGRVRNKIITRIFTWVKIQKSGLLGSMRTPSLCHRQGVAFRIVSERPVSCGTFSEITRDLSA